MHEHEEREALRRERGGPLPELAIPLTTSLIVGGALASRDFTPVHHDKSAAAGSGMQDVFMNILTTNGLVGRYVTDWAGPTRVRKVKIKLGTPNLPGDTMTFTGSVTSQGGRRGDGGGRGQELLGQPRHGHGPRGRSPGLRAQPLERSESMSRTLKDQAVIVGIGRPTSPRTRAAPRSAAGRRMREAAIQDAGLEPSDIDGMTSFTLDTSDEIEVARNVGCGDLTFFSRVNYGGGAAVGIVHQAAMAVATGSAKYVVGWRRSTAARASATARASPATSSPPT